MSFPDISAQSIFRRWMQGNYSYKEASGQLGVPGKVATHRQLLTEVWGPEQAQDTHYLRVFMAGLRRKIEDDSAQPRYLLTEQGVGYRFASE